MNRILVVEDNKALAKVISKKLKQELNFEIDTAYTLSEAKLFTAKYKYFLVLSDLNLPDAPNGEIIDYLTAKKCNIVVLSGTLNQEFRDKILNKDIIDYFTKSGIEDIYHIINTIKRLEKNQEHTILLVDDSIVFRTKTKKFLERLLFKVISVAHGEEAMNVMKTNNNISLVLTDYNMPVMDGFELTKAIRKEYSKNEISIIALSSNIDSATTAMFLKYGANDYIQKVFSKEEFTCRINNTIESLENIKTITNYANRDYLTGLYNRRYFFQYMNEEQESNNIAIAMIDIDNFKKVNDTYGHDIGDKVIVHLSEILRANTNYEDMVTRFGGEEFCIVLKNTDDNLANQILETLRVKVEESRIHINNQQDINFTISIGATMLNEDGVEESINRADMFLYKVKNSGKNRVLLG